MHNKNIQEVEMKYTNETYASVAAMPVLDRSHLNRLVMRRGHKETVMVNGVSTVVSKLYISTMDESPYPSNPDMTYGVYADSTIHDLRDIIEKFIADPPSGMKSALRLVSDAHLEVLMLAGKGKLDSVLNIYGHPSSRAFENYTEDALLFIEDEHERRKYHATFLRSFAGVEEKLKEVDELNTLPDIIEKTKVYICQRLLMMYSPRG